MMNNNVQDSTMSKEAFTIPEFVTEQLDALGYVDAPELALMLCWGNYFGWDNPDWIDRVTAQTGTEEPDYYMVHTASVLEMEPLRDLRLPMQLARTVWAIAAYVNTEEQLTCPLYSDLYETLDCDWPLWDEFPLYAAILAALVPAYVDGITPYAYAYSTLNKQLMKHDTNFLYLNRCITNVLTMLRKVDEIADGCNLEPMNVLAILLRRCAEQFSGNPFADGFFGGEFDENCCDEGVSEDELDPWAGVNTDIDELPPLQPEKELTLDDIFGESSLVTDDEDDGLLEELMADDADLDDFFDEKHDVEITVEDCDEDDEEDFGFTDEELAELLGETGCELYVTNNVSAAD